MKQPTPEQLSDPVVRRMLDKTMIQSPDDWPIWPVLPLKRRSEHNKRDLAESSAFVYGDPPPDGEPITIMLGVIYMEPLGQRTYPNVDALLDDGWTVD